MKIPGLCFSITFLILFSTTSLAGEGFRIKISLPDLPDSEVILSHRFGLKFYTDDTVRTDSGGLAEFYGTAPLPEGMYQLVFPNRKYVEFFLTTNQNFSISTHAAAPLDSITVTGSPENSRFMEWQKQFGVNRSRASLIQARIRKGNLPADSSRLLSDELNKVQQLNELLWDTAIRDLEGTLPGLFLRGMQPVRIPGYLENLATPEDQAAKYHYVRSHFFDQVDLTDERLLRTPLIGNRIDQYFRQILPQIADTLCREAMDLIERVRPSKNMFQFIVQYLFNLYTEPQIMGTDAVYVCIAENYYLAGETPWIDSANLRGIGIRVGELKPLLLGKVAPVLDGLVNPDGQALEIRNIRSEYLVLYFWSPDCGFCKESTPRLHEVYPELKELGAEVVAVNTHLEKDAWIGFISDHKLSWINVYAPLHIREIVERFQAFSTPVLYILDADRRIIAKNISVDQVTSFVASYRTARK